MSDQTENVDPALPVVVTAEETTQDGAGLAAAPTIPDVAERSPASYRQACEGLLRIGPKWSRERRCSKRATVHHEGRWYCVQHAPARRQSTVEEIVASLEHVIDVCTHQTCDLDHFERACRFTRALKKERLLVMTKNFWHESIHLATINGVELEQIAQQRADEDQVGSHGTPPLSEASGPAQSAAQSFLDKYKPLLTSGMILEWDAFESDFWAVIRGEQR